jgi:uncharacterized CHY-type Zn-finger protein
VKRKLFLFETFGEAVVRNCPDYKHSELIVCGICGNMTPEECYMNNCCPHCLMGIDYEVESEGSKEMVEQWEKNMGINEDE